MKKQGLIFVLFFVFCILSSLHLRATVRYSIVEYKAGDSICAGSTFYFKYCLYSNISAHGPYYYVKYDNDPWQKVDELDLYSTVPNTVCHLTPQTPLIIPSNKTKLRIMIPYFDGFRPDTAFSPEIFIKKDCPKCQFNVVINFDAPEGKNCVLALNRKEIVVFLSNGNILKTINGGKTWDLKINLKNLRGYGYSTELINLICNSDTSIIYAAMESIVAMSTDRGDTWKVCRSITGNDIYINFIAAGNNKDVLILSRASNSNYYTYFSTDALDTKLIRGVIPGNRVILKDLAFLKGSQNTFFTCGEILDAVKDKTIATLWRTDNGGLNWAQVYNLPGSGAFTKVAFSPNGENGILFTGRQDVNYGKYTTDGGNTWNSILTLPSQEYKTTNIAFVNNEYAVTINQIGTVFLSTNSGKNWDECSKLRNIMPTTDFDYGHISGFSDNFDIYLYAIDNYGNLFLKDTNIFLGKVWIKYPQNGEQWAAKTKRIIEWGQVGILKVNIYLLDEQDQVIETISKGIDAESLQYIYTIDSNDNNLKGKYKIRICSEEDPSIFDEKYVVIHPKFNINEDEQIKNYIYDPNKTDHQDAMGVCPTKAIVGNQSLTVGFSQQGKIVSFYYPSPGYYNHLPYETKAYAKDSKDKDFIYYFGAPAWAGSFAGIQVDDNPISWLFDANQWVTYLRFEGEDGNPIYSAPILKILYIHKEKNWSVEEISFVPPGSNSLLRKFKFSGEGNRVKFTYYGSFSPNIINQNPPLDSHALKKIDDLPIIKKDLFKGFVEIYSGWKFIGNIVTVSLDKIESEKFNTISFVRSWDIDTYKRYSIYILGHNVKDMSILNPDNINIGFTNAWNWKDTSGSMIFGFDRINYNQSDVSYTCLDCNTCGAMEYDISNDKEILVSINIAENEYSLKNSILSLMNKSYSTHYDETLQYWNDSEKNKYLKTINSLAFKTNEKEIKNYLTTWAMTLKLLTDKNGGIIASPNLQPKYYPMWPRDAVWQMLAWLLLNDNTVITKTLNSLFRPPFVESGICWQDSNYYYWRQCYSLDGSYQGFPFYFNSNKPTKLGIVEEDQMPLVLWFIWTWWKHSNIVNFDNFLMQNFLNKNSIRNLADYILESIVKQDILSCKRGKPGLLSPSFDSIEWLEIDGKLFRGWQSLYTNAVGAASMKAAYDMFNDKKYLDGCATIKKAIKTYLKDPKDNILKWAIVYGLNPFDVYLLDSPERCNLSIIWPFNVYSLNDTDIIRFKNSYIQSFKKNNNPKFIGDLFYNLIYQNIFQDEIIKYNNSVMDINGLIDYVKKRDDGNDIRYIPERIMLDNPAYKMGAEPLGWAQAMGILLGVYCSTDSKNRIPIINCDEVEYSQPDVKEKTVEEKIQIALNDAFTDENSIYDIGVIHSPITILVTNKDGLKTGIAKDTTLFYQFPSYLIIGDSIGSSMAIFLPRDSIYTFNITTYIAGKFTLEIWKSLRFTSCKWVHLTFVDSLGSGVDGFITLRNDVKTNNYKLYIDNDKDNVYEYEINPFIIDTCNFPLVVENILQEGLTNKPFVVYPNPSSYNANLHLYFMDDGFYSINLFNLLGEKVKTLIESKFFYKGEYDMEIDISDLPTGIYNLSLVSTKYSETFILIIYK